MDFKALESSLPDVQEKISFSNYPSENLQDVDISGVTIPYCFRSLQNHLSGKKHQAKLMVDVLTKIIVEKGANPIPTAYFALLISSLPNNIQEDELVLYLLEKIIPELPTSVLISRFKETISTLLACIQMSFDYLSNVKAVLKCIEAILRATAYQITSKKWALNQQLVTLFQALLALGMDNRSKIQTSAVACLNALYQHDNSKRTGKQSSKIFLKFFQQQFQNSKNTDADIRNLAAVVQMTIAVIVHFPSSIIAELITFLISQLRGRSGGANTLLLKQRAFQLFGDLFTHKPCPITTNNFSSIISEFIELKPRAQDTELVASYSKMMSNTLISLHEIDSNACALQLAPTIKFILSYVPVGKEELFEALFSSVENLITNCIDEDIKLEALSRSHESTLAVIISYLHEGLGYQYQNAWGYFLILFAALFKVIDKRFVNLVKTPLLSIEEHVKDVNSPFHKVSILAITSAIQSLTPEVILSVLPLNLNLPLQSEERREYLLPIFQQAISNSELAFFGKYFIPLAKSVKKQADDAEINEEFVRSKHYTLIYHQIWNILPTICSTYPTDLTENFKNIARLLGQILTESEDLRIIICNSLQLLITKNREVIESNREETAITVEKAKENITVIAAFSKNFLPILFNLYCTLPITPQFTAVRAQLSKTIEAFVSISSDDVINTFFSTVLKKLSTETDQETKNLLIELAQAFIGKIDNNNLGLLYDLVKPNLTGSDLTFQKKSYKIIEKICRSAQPFLLQHLNDIENLLIQRLANSKPSTKKIRFRAIRLVFPLLSDDEMKSLSRSQLMGEVILNVKENSSTREEALALLLTIANCLIQEGDDATPFLQIVSAGLAGSSSQMISATILSLTQLLKEYRGRVEGKFLDSLVKSVTALFATKQKDIQRSCLGFYKVTVSNVPMEIMQPYVPSIVSSTICMAEDSKNRLRIKIVFERLIRRFGYETIHELVPDKFKKMISNIQKSLKKPRENQKKTDDNDNLFSDDEEDEDEDQHMKDADKGKGKTNGPVLKEDNDEDIIDLLDPSGAKNSLLKKRGRTEAKDYKLNEEGKFIFDLGDVPSKKKKLSEDGDDDVDDYEKDSDDEDKQEAKKPVHIIDWKKNQKRSSAKAYSGQEFKGKGGGDVKRSSKFEPFAYVPLNPNLLNKRKRAKASSEFQSIVKSAKKGAEVKRKKSRK